MEVLLQIHSVVRWLALAAAVAVLGKFAAGLVRRSAFSRADRVLGAVYAGVLDAQALLGVILLGGRIVRDDELPPAGYILHALVMFFAVAAAHQTARWREAADARRFRNGLIAYSLSLALVLLGLVVIVQSG
jgi:hypothetical protein